MKVTFLGVRGSAPSASPETQRYGGHTSCVLVEAEGIDPIFFDLGTGLRQFRQSLSAVPFKANVLLSHLHWDHVQGLPFFSPLHRVDSDVAIYGPATEGMSLREAFDRLMGPPYFPVTAGGLAGVTSFCDIDPGEFSLGRAQVTAREVPHLGRTLGYRVEVDGTSVAYISDHQQPLDGDSVADSVLELANGADLLIHDSQFMMSDWESRSHWGHCTVGYALQVAARAGVKRLALFHHDPSRSDEQLDRLASRVNSLAKAVKLPEVFVASEGMTVDLRELSGEGVEATIYSFADGHKIVSASVAG